MTMLHLAASSNDDSTPEPQPQEDLFDSFWTLFPRHEAKKDAHKAWDRLTQKEKIAAIIAVAEWRNVWIARGTETQYIKLPGTWLRQECWDDELPRDLQTRPASHALAKLPELVARGEIPDKVRAQIARLKGQR